MFVYLHGKALSAEFATSSAKKVRLIYLNNSGMKKEQIQVIQTIPLLPSLTFLSFLLYFISTLLQTLPQSTHLRELEPNL